MAKTFAPNSRLRQHPFIAGAKHQFYSLLEECGELQKFEPHLEIIEDGTKADEFFLIFNGEVELQKFVPGVGMITIQRLGAGDVVGCSWLFPPYWWRFSAITRQPTEAMVFNGALLRARAEEDFEFRQELLTRFNRTLITRLEAALEQLVDSSRLGAIPRIA